MTAPSAIPNGRVAAAVLSCGLGSFLLGVLTVAADGSKSLAAALTFYGPTGPVSGVTTVAIALWLISWIALAARWKTRSLAFGKIAAASFALLAVSLLLTFPPFGDIFLGR